MIHLIIGNTGAGKTTFAQDLQKKTKGIVFSIDQWNKTLFLPDKTEEDGLEWFLERIERSESLILDLIQQLEASETDSILDLGLSKKAHRDKFLSFAQRHHFAICYHYLDLSKEDRYARIQQRNTEKGATFAFTVSKEDFDFMETWFEAPTEEEKKYLHVPRQ